MMLQPPCACEIHPLDRGFKILSVSTSQALLGGIVPPIHEDLAYLSDHHRENERS